MDPVVHFEMPYEDRERVAKFYEAAFSWRMQMLGAEMGNYVLAGTTESGERGPRQPGAINGGFFPKTADGPREPSIVIAVEDIRASIGKVTAAGGKLQGEPMEIPGIGTYAAFIDPEGNRVGMLQPLPRAVASEGE